MAYITLALVTIVWFTIIKVRGGINWHATLNIVFFSMIIIDIIDIIICYILGLFSLRLRLFESPGRDIRDAILISDLVIMPLMIVIYTFYYSKNKKWWIVAAFPVVLAGIEYIFLRAGFIEYHNFSFIYTLIAYCVGSVFFTLSYKRFVHYKPPFPFPLVAASASYISMAFPGTVFGTTLELFQWKPGIFTDYIADNWVVAVGMGLISGLIAWLGFAVFKTRTARYWIIAAVGVVNIILSFILQTLGKLVYHHWNSIFQVLMFAVSTIALILYFRWEARYRENILIIIEEPK